MPGWIKLHRSTLDWEWYSDANTARVFFHFLLKANFEKTRYQGVDIPIGCLVTGYEALAEKLGISIQQTRTAIDKLKSSNQITVTRHSKFSLVQIVNWYDYQEDNSQITVNQQSDNNHLTPYKEIKNIRNKEIKTPDLFGTEITLPPWMPLEAWEAFKAMRKKMREPVSDHAAKLLIGKLENFRSQGHDPKAIIEESIMNNWKGFFPPKASSVTPKTSDKPKASGAITV